MRRPCPAPSTATQDEPRDRGQTDHPEELPTSGPLHATMRGIRHGGRDVILIKAGGAGDAIATREVTTSVEPIRETWNGFPQGSSVIGSSVPSWMLFASTYACADRASSRGSSMVGIQRIQTMTEQIIAVVSADNVMMTHRSTVIRGSCVARISYYAAPQPPPPGVSIVSTSPAATSNEALPPRFVVVPSGWVRVFWPRSPGWPPCMP